MQAFSSFETKFIFEGPIGDIEMITTEPVAEKDINKSVIICHPHPLHGGAMGNKVVSTLAKAFHEYGLKTVRFNFRGVGKSTGEHDNGYGETDDLIAIYKWMKAKYPNDKFWLSGFSFGGFVAARAASKLPIERLITIAPQASRFVKDALPALDCPWLIVQGEADEVTNPEELYNWVKTRQDQISLVKIPEAGHYFHKKLTDLRKVLDQELISKCE